MVHGGHHGSTTANLSGHRLLDAFHLDHDTGTGFNLRSGASGAALPALSLYRREVRTGCLFSCRPRGSSSVNCRETTNRTTTSRDKLFTPMSNSKAGMARMTRRAEERTGAGGEREIRDDRECEGTKPGRRLISVDDQQELRLRLLEPSKRCRQGRRRDG